MVSGCERICGQFWVFEDRDSEGRLRVDEVLRAAAALRPAGEWLVWASADDLESAGMSGLPCALPGTWFRSLSAGDFARLVDASISGWDELWLRDRDQRIELGVFDSAYAFVCGEPALVAEIVSRVGRGRRVDSDESPQLSPISRVANAP